jgi:hypothetical protein
MDTNKILDRISLLLQDFQITQDEINAMGLDSETCEGLKTKLRWLKNGVEQIEEILIDSLPEPVNLWYEN